MKKEIKRKAVVEKEYKLTKSDKVMLKKIIEKRFIEACKKHKVQSLGFTDLDPQDYKDLAMITSIIEGTGRKKK